MDKNYISASWFTTLDYCEYKFFMDQVLGIKAPRTYDMVKGTEIHEAKEQEFKKEAEPIVWEDFLKSKEYVITKEVNLKVKYENITLLGRVDEIGSDANGIYIIDDKPKAKPYDGVKNQLFFYCYVFKRSFSDKTAKPIYAVLRDRDSDEEVWREQFNLNNEFMLVNKINRVKKIMSREIEPISTDNPNKCRACIMHQRGLCKFSLISN